MRSHLVIFLLLLLKWGELAGGELRLVMVPLGRALAGEPIHVWGVVLDRAGIVHGRGEFRYRWEVTGGTECQGDDLGTWMGADETGDMTAVLCCHDAGPLQVRLTVSDDSDLELVGEVSLDVLRSEDVGKVASLGMRKRMGVLRGLHWLQLHQHEDGHWGAPSVPIGRFSPPYPGAIPLHNEIASTGMSLWSYGVHGFGLGMSGSNPFEGTVQRGLSYLARQACYFPRRASSRPVPLDELDVNGNGRRVVLGGHGGVDNYYHPIALCGILSAGQKECQVVTSAGPVSLYDLSADCRDTILSHLHMSDCPGWNYTDRVLGQYRDLSIAGWNFLALWLCDSWFPSLSYAACLRIQDFLSSHFDLSSRKFVYTEHYSEGETISLAASGIVGCRLLFEEGSDELCRLKASDVSGHGYHGSDEYIPLGEVECWTLRKLFRWIWQGDLRSDGYSLWNACKALMICNVTAMDLNGTLFDWRYGSEDDSVSGAWEQVLNLQNHEGTWEIDEWHDLHSYQTELHHALMVLSLGETVHRPPVESSYDLTVSWTVPREIEAHVQERQGVTVEQLSDGRRRYSAESTLRDGEAWNLDWIFSLSEDESRDWILIQEGGVVSWKHSSGEQGTLPLRELWLRRLGTAYGVSLSWSGEQSADSPDSIGVKWRVPAGEHQSPFRLPRGKTGVFPVLEGLTGPVATWLSVEYLSGNAGGSGTWVGKSHGDLCHWLELGHDVSGLRGRSLGVRLDQSLAEEVIGVLHYQTSPLVLTVWVTDSRGRRHDVFKEAVRPGDFGGDHSLTVSCPHLPVGEACCHATLVQGDVVVASAETVSLMRGKTEPVVMGGLKVGREFAEDLEVLVVSEVLFPEGNGIGIGGEVELWLEGAEGLFHERWSLNPLDEGLKQAARFLLSPDTLSSGTHVVRQRVTLSDGREFSSEASFVVHGPRSTRQVRFSESAYEWPGEKVEFSVPIVYTGSSPVPDIGLVAVEDSLAELEIGDLSLVTGVEGEAKVVLQRGDLSTETHGLMALVERNTGRLLDVGELTVRARADSLEPEGHGQGGDISTEEEQGGDENPAGSDGQETIQESDGSSAGSDGTGETGTAAENGTGKGGDDEAGRDAGAVPVVPVRGRGLWLMERLMADNGGEWSRDDLSVEEAWDSVRMIKGERSEVDRVRKASASLHVAQPLRWVSADRAFTGEVRGFFRTRRLPAPWHLKYVPRRPAGSGPRWRILWGLLTRTVEGAAVWLRGEVSKYKGKVLSPSRLSSQNVPGAKVRESVINQE